MVCYSIRKVRWRLTLLVRAAGTQQACARQIGISQSYLSDILLGRRRVPPRVLRRLGLQRVEHYQRIR